METRYCIEYVNPLHPFLDNGGINVRYDRVPTLEQAEDALILILSFGGKILDLYMGNVVDGETGEWTPKPAVIDDDDWVTSKWLNSLKNGKTNGETTISYKDREVIIAAAYKVKPEYVCNDGGVYKTGTKERDDIYHCRIGRHHAEILHIFGKEVDEFSDGFYTSHGRWVDRKEAAEIALAAGQCRKPLIMGDILDSSDVF